MPLYVQPPVPPDTDSGSNVQGPNILPPAPPPEDIGGALAPPLGNVIRDQLSGLGRYSRGLVPKWFKLDSAKDVNAAKHEPIPGNVLQVLVAQGGAIPDDARISIGGSDWFPLVEGFVYETDQPFDGYDVYWPTAAAGVTVWIVVAFGRANRADANSLQPARAF
ncbi:MAG TPA: hypothetical protein VI670_27735 [Thermoanaerobaculia bacterium]|jgi:hypothetical protein